MTVVLIHVQGQVASIRVADRIVSPARRAKMPTRGAEPPPPALPDHVTVETRRDRCLGVLEAAPAATWSGRTGRYWCPRCGPINRTRTVRVHYPGGA